MRQLCLGHGTTLLLVTHDIYSAMNLCDRFIWIDRGKMCFDGDAKTAVARYEASIKQQEEDRLRKRAVISLSADKEPAASRVHVLFRSATGFALPSPLALEYLELQFPDGTKKSLDVAGGSADWNLLPEGNLGPVEQFEGRTSRTLSAGESIYHKAEWYVPLSDGQSPRELRVRCNYTGDERVDVRVFTDTRMLLGKGELTGATGWREMAFELSSKTSGELDAINQTVYGTGAARLTSVSFIGADGQPVLRARHGEPLTIRLDVHVPGKLKVPEATLQVGFNRPGLPYGGYAYTQRLYLQPGHHYYTVDVKLEPLLLGSGTWMMTTSIGEPDLYTSNNIPYFTIDKRWYHFIARGVELEVASTVMIDQCGCFMVHPARIVAEPTDAADESDLGQSRPTEDAYVER
jgi:lipopolysaccharide transport system ATP-binding protein